MVELRNIRHESMSVIPWDDRRVTFILISNGLVWTEKTVTGKIEI